MSQSVSAQDLFRLKSVTQPTVAAGQVVVVENRVDQASNSYLADLKRVDLQGRQQTLATTGKLAVQPVIVGDQVYYAANVGDAKAQLFRFSLAGGTPEQLTTAAEEAVTTVLASADGQYVYFKTTATAEQPKLPSPQAFPQTRHVDRLINKADGYGWLPLNVTYRLRCYQPETGAVTELFQHGFDFDVTSVSADGRYVTVLHNVQPDNDRDFARGAYCYDATTGETVELTTSIAAGRFEDATLSPDGQRVALVGDDGTFGRHTVANVYVVDRTGNQMQNLTADLAADPAPEMAADFIQQQGSKLVRWLDSERVVFTAVYHAHSQLYVGNATDGIERVDNTARQIVDFDVVDAHTVVLAVSYQDQPSVLVTHNLTQQTERVLYNPNAAYEETHTFAHPQRFDFESADGQALEGWYLPAQTTAPKQPVLLYVHGGPHGNYGETFFHEFQVHASRGFGVVFFNPRGSTSYGQDFESDVNGHYGEHDFSDVMTGLDVALQKFPQLDADRQYIAGGSYGGFMTTWAIGHTKRFAAAIAQRPVTNWISLFGTSDIGFYFNPEELGTDLFAEGGVASYWRQSPLAYAQQVTTPIRLLHGEWDMRCPISQSEEYFTAVKRHGVDADMIRYPQSFHGVSRNGLPNLRLQRLDDMTEWFTAHPTVKH
ncbi:S9 family peptidase [Levilactobacillus brevis]|uniref:S9 family peptidase n=1 Tax=Levilactobacillus brevis TaxID=1580 RepID=UPI000BE8DB28|nr:S9 family peptidase [Levilactobacillus brevis]MCZ2118945.1 S9 family peptidase [Levilactobacillus brevis]MCZ2124414.1 S9 family peptidase [Levilactobacillus brevis]MCZ2208752.1 S9 family peptidase [Levilactobacillus brevis]MCZ2324197.1 S9 family peptidase [Levilactobacillus brevis]